MQRICPISGTPFEITDADMAFLDKVSPMINGKKYAIPPPSLSPDARLQRRLASINMRNLHRRKNDMTGETLISIYPPESKRIICEERFWWGDDWDPLEYGRDFDFSRSFFEQYEQLLQVVPHANVVIDGNENCDFTNYVGWSQDCYLCFCADRNQDCMYLHDVIDSTDCYDCLLSYKLQRCYECIDCKDCYAVLHAENSENCSDSQYLYDCIGCKNCIGCTGLRQKEYCILNDQYSEQEYGKRKREVAEDPSAFKVDYQALLQKHPRRPTFGLHNENVSGDYLYHCRNSFDCFDCVNMEDSRYCTNMKGGGKDCYDLIRWGNPAEKCYESCGVGEGATNVAFCCCCWNGISDLYYCQFCISCSNCFGCVGLRHKQYCIFNKQYEKEEYFAHIAKLIEHMQSTHEWGEYFPTQQSAFPYNESDAMEYYPLDTAEIERQKWWYREHVDEIPQVDKIIPADKLPQSIGDVPDDVLNWAIECEVSRRPFKVQKRELEFYRDMDLPLPKLHPDERHKKRMAKRNPRKLWERECGKCGEKILTTYSPERLEIVWCETCYLAEVY